MITRTAPARPLWLHEPCPDWCNRDHAGQHMRADRTHLSDIVTVPVIERHPGWVDDAEDDSAEDVYTPEVASLVLVRQVGHPETRVAIATEQYALEVTVESARRLHRELGYLLQTAADSRA